MVDGSELLSARGVGVTITLRFPDTISGGVYESVMLTVHKYVPRVTALPVTRPVVASSRKPWGRQTLARL
jgi:hypothetical protein